MMEGTPRLPYLKTKTETFPRLPGVYLMSNESGEVIYVGKARDLRARVRTYMQGGDGRVQIEFLLRKIHEIETIVTENEQQAFILERDMITKHKPRYNIRLKDDKAYLSVRIDQNSAWPRIELVRRVAQDGARYFGPYSFGHELRSLLEVIKRAVPLRSCTDTVFFNRQRPCLEYQIKRCAGPCCLEVSRDDYAEWVQAAISILEGNAANVISQLNQSMEVASQELRFEDAATLRDRIEVLKNSKKSQPLISRDMESRDVFALYREERLAALSVLVTRLGRIVESVNYSFQDVVVSDGELLEAAISQFYESGREIPDEILVSSECENRQLLEKALGEKRGAALEILQPQRGVKFRLLNLARMNASQHYVTSFDSETRYLDVAKEIAKRFNLKQVPRRIECVDISNLQGSDIVGANVAFFDGEPDKARYRHYKISKQGKPDDFAAIFEVVTRRLSRALAEGDFPDVLIIDGGPGQLAAACTARNKLRLELDIIAIAKMKTEPGVSRLEVEKKPERIFLEGSNEPIVLPAGEALTRFLQRVRDEVHRFVITFHKKQRTKRVFRSELDDLPGLGVERRTRLLREFGSLKGMRSKTAEEIARAGKMPLPLAQKVLELAIQKRK